MCVCVACLGEYDISSGDGPLPMAIFELLEYIVNEVSTYAAPQSSQSRSSGSPGNLQSPGNCVAVFDHWSSMCPTVLVMHSGQNDY